jgi:hypothetical protein
VFILNCALIHLPETAVIINEHLMEALRRLRRNSTDTNVDRRLVTNVLLSFLATPRADPKRFEMLSLLATVLSWTDPEREKAGLQRAHNDPPAAGNTSFWSRSPAASPAKELDKADETEVFLFVMLSGCVRSALGITVTFHSHFLAYGWSFSSQKQLLAKSTHHYGPIPRLRRVQLLLPRGNHSLA